MRISFTPEAFDDFLYWQQHHPKQVKRIHELIRDILRQPFSGLGKPEPLKHQLQGCWSRRIDSEHRLVYQVAQEQLVILSVRYHYQK